MHLGSRFAGGMSYAYSYDGVLCKSEGDGVRPCDVLLSNRNEWRVEEGGFTPCQAFDPSESVGIEAKQTSVLGRAHCAKPIEYLFGSAQASAEAGKFARVQNVFRAHFR